MGRLHILILAIILSIGLFAVSKQTGFINFASSPVYFHSVSFTCSDNFSDSQIGCKTDADWKIYASNSCEKRSSGPKPGSMMKYPTRLVTLVSYTTSGACRL